ncbi:MAG: siderophore-interacting protein [Nocardioidaceae bacterium]
MHGEVRTKDWLTPGLVRVVLGGSGLDSCAMADATDAYVNVAFRPSGAPYGAVFDPARVLAEHPREVWPARRRYTIRSWDSAAREMTIDFVVHGAAGVGGPWAAAAQQGDVLVFEGPSGGYRPDPTADWHLFVGDESALPAIAASLEALPYDSLAVVRVVCDGPADELKLTTSAVLDLGWLHRSRHPGDDDVLPRAIEDLVFPGGRVHAFVHGEADEIRQIRRHLLADRGLTRSDMSCSPYWRRSMTDESWRQRKQAFVAAMESDVA